MGVAMDVTAPIEHLMYDQAVSFLTLVLQFAKASLPFTLCYMLAAPSR